MPIQQMFLGLGAAKDLNRYIWGRNYQPPTGGLGLNDGPNDQYSGTNSGSRSSPTLLTAGDVPWVGASTLGIRATSMVREDGTLWAWGNNSPAGLLGQSQPGNTLRSSPVQIPGTTWSSSYEKRSGSGHAYNIHNIKTDGTLWGWGANPTGAIGTNNDTYYSSPVQIPGTTWAAVKGEYRRTHATKSDGTLWSWGQNNDGALGVNQPDNTHYSSPKQIPGTTWTTNLVANKGGGCCIKTNGELWCWGSSDNGRLGQGSPVPHKKSPIQIPGTTWSKIAGDPSKDVMFGIKTDGTLWSWGLNQNGQLGHNQGPGNNYSSPKQIPGTTWASVRAGNHVAAAVKTDGTLWTWGRNSDGQLGQNQAGAQLDGYSSPVQVGSATGWQADTLSVGEHSIAATLEE